MSAVAKTVRRVEPAPPPILTEEQVELLKRTVCREASDDEFSLFLMTCRRTGLDPFAKQIYAVMRFDKRANRKVMTIQTGIDGFRLIAERTGEIDGQEGPYWCGKDGIWRDVWLDAGPPVAAKVVVCRRKCSRPWTGIAHWREYAGDSHFWQHMPANQLAKVAESLALRKAFPQDLSGIYTVDEMDGAEAEPATRLQPPAAPAPKPLPAPPPPAQRWTVGELVRAMDARAVADGKAGQGALLAHLYYCFPDQPDDVDAWPEAIRQDVIARAKQFVEQQQAPAGATP